jgi:prophage maintenance system killer protein
LCACQEPPATRREQARRLPCLLEFLARNGRRFQAADVDATIDMMIKIAGSEVEQAEVEDWIRRQID